MDVRCSPRVLGGLTTMYDVCDRGRFGGGVVGPRKAVGGISGAWVTVFWLSDWGCPDSRTYSHHFSERWRSARLNESLGYGADEEVQ